MKLIFPELMMNNNSICWMTLAHWLIEASFFPLTILFIVSGSYYVNLWEEYLLEEDPRVISAVAYVSKGILFVVMRYAEMFPSSKINQYQIEFLYPICGKSYINSTFDNYRLQLFLHSHKV